MFVGIFWISLSVFDGVCLYLSSCNQRTSQLLKVQLFRWRFSLLKGSLSCTCWRELESRDPPWVGEVPGSLKMVFRYVSDLVDLLKGCLGQPALDVWS